MLTRNSKKLLDAVNKLHNNGIQYPNMKDLQTVLTLPKDEIMSTALYLQQIGYIHVDFGKGDTILLIESKHKGNHYKELIHIERMNFIKRSIIVPILVSLVASTLFWLIKK
ncbi:MAG: hypothetical protein ACRC1T_12050 [Clostridium chrysemydis]|uniref:hypothetical protein n=1 Tax=Clostridium chrysemydis TaxID=2665504 RepID=UPI003F396C7D